MALHMTNWLDAYSNPRVKVLADLEPAKRAILDRELREMFSKWVSKGRKGDFNRIHIVGRLSEEAKSGLINSLNHGPLLAQLLIRTGIDPDAVLNLIRLRGRFDDSETRDRLCSAIRDVARQIGESNLNDNYMNNVQRKEEIIVPDTLRRQPGPFPLSEKHGHMAKIRLGSFQMRCRAFFGSWDKALTNAGFDLNEIKKKIASADHTGLIRTLDEFDRDSEGSWSYQDLRDSDPALCHTIQNNTRINKDKMPFSDNLNGMRVAIANLLHYRDNGCLKEDMFWFESNEQRIEEEYRSHHFQKIYLADIPKLALERYSKGKSFSRGVTDKEGRSLISACRTQDRDGKDYRKTLGDAGILTEKLHQLEQACIDLGGEPKAVGMMRQLVAEAIDAQDIDQMLSRGYVERFRPEAFQVAHNLHHVLTKGMNWRKSGQGNDWSGVLTTFGLNPAVFELNARKRTKRGFAFQRFVRNELGEVMLEVDSPTEVVSGGQFCSNKSLGCNHDIKCRPDFILKGSLLDTKTGGKHLKKSEEAQMERYLEHRDEVIVITLNTNDHIKDFENGSIRFIKFTTFVQQSEDIIGVKLDPGLPQKLTEYLRYITNSGQEIE